MFHKDYLDDWEKVKEIRENTVFLYVALLGSVDENLLTSDVLGILDLEYDRLFAVLDRSDPEAHYTFVLRGRENKNMHITRRTEGLKFDKNGCVTNTIEFYKYNYYDDRKTSKKISRTRIPSEVWIEDRFGNKERKITW